MRLARLAEILVCSLAQTDRATCASLCGQLESLAKVAQHTGSQAARAHRVPDHLAQQALTPFAQRTLLCGSHSLRILGRLDEVVTGADVSPAPQQIALRRLPVTSATTRLLVVLLERLGHAAVDHIAHVALVDAHAKGVGRHHHLHVIVDEGLLGQCALLVAHARMVGCHPNAFVAELVGDLLDLLARRRIHDAHVVSMRLDVVARPSLSSFGRELERAELEVGAVESTDLDGRIAQIQQVPHVLLHPRGGCCRKGCHNWTLGERGHEVGDVAICGTEVVAPLAHAMSLVDRHEGDVGPCGKGSEIWVCQTLGSHIHQVVPSRKGPAQHLGTHPWLERRVVVGASNSSQLERMDLVRH